MARVRHKDITPAQGVHVMQDWEVADLAGLATITPAPLVSEIGKVAMVQGAPNTFYILTGVGPLTWAAFAEGVPGADGNPNMSDSTPSPTGVAAAGVSTAASRGDHAHALGTVNTSDVTGLDANLAAKQASIDAINLTLSGTAGPTNVYISGVNGNDANNGLTAGTAVATFARVWALLPQILYAPFVVHIGAHGGAGYTYTLPPDDQVLAPGAYIALYGDGAGQAGEDGFIEVATGAAGAGTTSKVLELAVSPATDAYAGYTVQYTSGTASGQRRLIRDTIGALATLVVGTETITAALTPVAGDTYRVLRPAAKLILTSTHARTSTTNFTTLARETPVHAVNVNLSAATTLYLTIADSTSTTFFFGVEYAAPLVMAPQSGHLVGGFDGISDPIVKPTLLLKTLVPGQVAGTWNGWGISAPGVFSGSGGGFLPNVFTGYVVAEVVRFMDKTVFVGGRAATFFNGKRGAVGYIDNSGCFFSAAAVPFLVRSSSTSTTVAVSVANGSRLVLTSKLSTVLALVVDSVTTSASFVGIYLTDKGELIGTNAFTVSAPSSTGAGVYLQMGFVFLRYLGSGVPLSSINMPLGTGIVCEKDSIFQTDGWTGITAVAGVVVSSRGSMTCSRSGPTPASFTITATGRAVSVEGASLAFTGGDTVWSGSDAAGGAVRVTSGGTFVQTDPITGGRAVAPGTLTITNNAVGAAAHGLQVSGGASAYLRGAANTLINANGYGVDARFGGRVSCGAQPSSVVGATADLIVDSTVGGQPDTALAASESAIAFSTGGLGAFNGSTIARTS